MMKSPETRTTTILENLLIPYRIRPYRQDAAAMEKKEAIARRNFHLLELTEPHHLLQKIFKPYLLVVRVLGCFPVRIRDGSASFAYCSWNVAYSLLVFGIFVGDTTFFFPIMRHMNSKQDENFVAYVTEIILVLSQIFVAQMSYIFIALRAKQLAEFWNRLQLILVKLVARCPNHLDLLPSYRSARMKISIWLMFTLVLGACYMISFHDDIWAYLRKESGNEIYNWFMFSGFSFYSVMLSIHILHSTSFTTFACVICTCFQSLGNIALKQDAQGQLMNSQQSSSSTLLFEEVIEIYDELLHLKCVLGGIYGIYMALEILAMIICCTINIFIMISRPEDSSLLCLNVAIVVPYLIWFHEICKGCGYFNLGIRQCYSNIRKAICIASKKLPSFPEKSYLHVEQPECLSACGYFEIDMKLFTTVMSTIATYLVVMLQFGAGMKGYNGSALGAAGPRNVTN